MSARATRVKRRASPEPQEDAEAWPAAAAAAAAAAAEPEQRRKGKRRSSGAAAAVKQEHATASAVAAAGGAARHQQQQQHAAPRAAQQRVRFSQAEAAHLNDKIAELQLAAQEAQERAQALGVSQTVLEGLVARVVRFMLFRCHEKPDVPAKRKELTDLVQCDQRGLGKLAKKLPAVVLPLAAARLASAFGLEMRELARPAPGDAAAAGGAGAAAAAAAASAAASGGQASYVLRSLLPSGLLTRYVQEPLDNPARGLTVVVLGLLQLAGGRMDADELWRHLGSLGASRDDHGPGVFGPKGPGEVLARMERARYLSSSKQAGAAGGEQVVYAWGEAAHDAFGGQVLTQHVNQWLGTDGGAAPTTAE